MDFQRSIDQQNDHKRDDSSKARREVTVEFIMKDIQDSQVPESPQFALKELRGPQVPLCFLIPKACQISLKTIHKASALLQSV